MNDKKIINYNIFKINQDEFLSINMLQRIKLYINIVNNIIVF